MKARSASVSPAECYATITKAFADDPSVTVGAGRKKGFGASALATHGKIFAMLSSRNCFVVKLPKARVDQLVVAEKGARFDPGHGRVMKEWFEAGSGSTEEWLSLAQEAREFVAAKS
jgi:hypothetical protein